MISLNIYVAMLLILGVISLCLILRVFFKQVKMLGVPFTGYDDETQKVLVRFRLTLFSIVLAIIIISMALGSVNILTLFIETNRPRQIGIGSFFYSLGIHTLLLLLSYLVARLYSIASDEKIHTDQTQHNLEKELQDEKDK